MDHKYQTAFRLGMPLAFILLPGPLRLTLGGALLFGQPLLMKAIPKITKERDFRKFKAQHPEIGSDMMRKEFDLEYPTIQRQKGLDIFAKHHQEWYAQLKALNPTIDENIIKSCMMIKAKGYHSGNEELRQIVTQLAGEATNAGLMKYLVIPALISAPVNMLLAQTGLSPLVDHIISAAVQSAAATGGSMRYLDTTMGKTKQYIAQTHPELIPENRRRNGNSRVKSTQS
jgi:hypothetical protein